MNTAAHIERIMGIDEERRAQLIYQEGEQYLADRFGAGKMLNALRYNSHFWNYWRMYWDSRDAEFIAQYSGEQLTEEDYLDYHRLWLADMWITPMVYKKAKKEATWV